MAQVNQLLVVEGDQPGQGVPEADAGSRVGEQVAELLGIMYGIRRYKYQGWKFHQKVPLAFSLALIV